MDRDPKSVQAISYVSKLSTKAKEFFVKITKEKNNIGPEEFVFTGFGFKYLQRQEFT